jgi:hypothetical protein
MSANYYRFVLSLMTTCAMAAIAMFMASKAFAAGPRLVADTFTATTANMTPAGVTLRLQIIEWQDAEARAQAVATLAAGAEGAAALGKLPTVGYVWPNGSPVGYSLKYTHREPMAGGGERVTLVTDRRLGSFDFKGWSVASPAVGGDRPYSVIELELNPDGTATGTFSLAADVALDETAGTVALAEHAGAPPLLTNVVHEKPKP